MKKSKPIVLIGNTNDLSMLYIKWLCLKKSVDSIELDEEDFGENWYFYYNDQSVNTGEIFFNQKKIFVEDISGIYIRLTPDTKFFTSDFTNDEKEIFIRERRQAIRHFVNSFNGKVINKLNGGFYNMPKTYQMKILEKNGFKVPEWILSNRSEDIKNFYEYTHNKAVYKSCSGLRSIVKTIDDNFINDIEDGNPPVIIQKYVSGSDCRVHVVNKSVFYSKISSDTFNFDNDNCQYSSDIPENIKETCIRLTENEYLALTGFDFKITENNEWYCLEMDTNPTFLPFEVAAKQEIGNAIVDYLSK